jgi:hypothetical protein
MKRFKVFTTWLVLALVLLMAGGAANALAQEQTGAENFIFINYIGQEMTFDLDDVTYRIPGTDTVPEGGRLALQLPVGEHKYAANIPGVAGSAGEFTITPGGYVAKAARLDKTGPTVDHRGILLEEPRDIVHVFDFDPFAAPVEAMPVVDAWQPAAAAFGKASLVFVNYTGDELTVDLNGQLYRVPPAANSLPGRVQLDVDPGTYRYTASVPGGSLNDEVTVGAGQVTGLNITAGLPPEREYEVGEAYDFLLPVTLQLFKEDLTARASAPAQQAQAPATDTPPVQQAETPAADLPPAVPGSDDGAVATGQPAASAEGLRVKNYAGETLIFTINNQAYSIPDHGELTIPLPPGSYSYTASRPFVATTGTVELQPNQGVELSVAINVAGDVLSVYQN